MLKKAAHEPGGKQQAGGALITALLVVALVAVMASSLARRLNIDIQRTANLTAAEQALALTQGVEAWALGMLRADALVNTTDHPGETWNLPLPPTETDDALVAGRIIALDGRFNLNALIDEHGAIVESRRDALLRLFQILDVREDLAHALMDWLDKDSRVRFPSGAEDLEYLSMDPPYRAANGPMSDVSELLLVRGFDWEAFERLRPFVATLPPDAALNVNVASVEVLRAWVPRLGEAAANALLKSAEAQALESVDAFLSHPDVHAGEGVDKTALAVRSRFFLVESWVELGPARLHLQSELSRTADGAAGIVRRDLGASYWTPVLDFGEGAGAHVGEGS